MEPGSIEANPVHTRLARLRLWLLLLALALTGAPPAPAIAIGFAGSLAGSPAGSTALTTRELLRTLTPPARNEADLALRFTESCLAATPERFPLYRDEQVGESRPFWVLDEPNRRFFQVQATLRHVSEHLLFYVQDGSAGARVSAVALARSAEVFETKTLPLLLRYFGDLPEKPRITIFNGNVPGVGGYFSSSDMLPKSVNPYSNERPMVFMSLDATRPGTGRSEEHTSELQSRLHLVCRLL